MPPTDSTEPHLPTVQERLITATGALLAEKGPTQVSLRDVEERSGINKGQIHHYFGGKQGLIEATVLKLSRDHYSSTAERSGGPIPAPLTLALDPQFWQVLVRLIIDDHIDLATLEIEHGLSVPRRALNEVTGGAEASPDQLSSLATVMVIELGWAAFGDYVAATLSPDNDGRAAMKQELQGMIADRLAQIYPDG